MKTETMLFCVILLVTGVCCDLIAEEPVFKHPSVLSTQAGLDSLKKRVISDPISKQAFAKFKDSKYADPTRPHTPYAIVKVVPSGTCKEEDAFRNDSQAAHAMALMWVITGESRYRDKAISILNDWASTYKEIVEGAQIQLETAWAVPVWVAAADIIRYYDNGAAQWSGEDIETFDRFLDSMVKTARGACRSNNNWGTSATLAIMAAGVYQDDRGAYNEAIRLHKQKLKSISKDSGALGADYLRDPWHPQYTILTWIQISELAWNQGDDLYGLKLDGQPLPRLAICLEHFSKLFLGVLPNPEGLKRGDYQNGHKNRQGYDMAYNHYILRQQLAEDLPNFTTMVPAWRPGGIDTHFLGWDTLTHGKLNSPQNAPTTPTQK